MTKVGRGGCQDKDHDSEIHKLMRISVEKAYTKKQLESSNVQYIRGPSGSSSDCHSASPAFHSTLIPSFLVL